MFTGSFLAHVCCALVAVFFAFCTAAELLRAANLVVAVICRARITIVAFNNVPLQAFFLRAVAGVALAIVGAVGLVGTVPAGAIDTTVVCAVVAIFAGGLVGFAIAVIVESIADFWFGFHLALTQTGVFACALASAACEVFLLRAGCLQLIGRGQ